MTLTELLNQAGSIRNRLNTTDVNILQHGRRVEVKLILKFNGDLPYVDIDLDILQVQMTREKIKAKVIEVLARKLGFPEDSLLDESLNLWDDLEMDSLDQVEIAFELEKIFNIKIPDAVAYTIKTIKDAIDLVEERLNTV